MIKHTPEYELGYSTELSKQQKTEFRNLFFEKSFLKGLAATSVYITSIYLTLIYLAKLSVTDTNSILVLTFWLIGLVFVVRQMRALENIVHFGSHSNFCRNRPLNDLMTNCLAAWPMLQDVAQYRKFHSLHHGDYGSHDDPCRARFEAMGVNCGDLNNSRKLIIAIFRWMPLYVREFYREVKTSHRQLAIFTIWHGLVSITIYLTWDWQTAAVVLLSWLICMFVVLPFLRSIAEFSEHDYERANNVKDTTFNNLGLMDHLLLHPAGDAWHALHHLYPVIPWWKQGAAHRYLMKHDGAYRSALHRNQVFQHLIEMPVTHDRSILS
ncbi:fatty acid desaturase [Ahrensia sp. 13_GOM-1096m]|uniref:fatty acid desaturase n=1 Tax=Ahrensia sp. 13_GOM-1096m TaxID=1380380 RepID=UPI000686449D|nr:fatty acid desaturase [Ahrensia sp. 13_GOM-1096m]